MMMKKKRTSFFLPVGEGGSPRVSIQGPSTLSVQEGQLVELVCTADGKKKIKVSKLYFVSVTQKAHGTYLCLLKYAGASCSKLTLSLVND